MACCHMGGCFSRKETRLMEKRKQEEYTNKLERDLAQAIKELQEKHVDVQTLTLERQNAVARQEELEEQLADAWRERALAETRAAVAEMQYSDMDANIKASQDKVQKDLAQAMKALQEKSDDVQTVTLERQIAMTRQEELEGQLADALREVSLAETRAAVAERDLAQAIKELQERRDDVQTLTLERQNAVTRQVELEEQLADALRERALAETRAAVAEMQYSDMDANIKASQDKIEELQQKLDKLLNHCQCTFRSHCKTKKCTCYASSRSCNTCCRCNMQQCMNTG